MQFAVYGYKLLWVALLSNLIAMSIQLMSAKLGIATCKNLAEHIRNRFPSPIVWFYWIQAEIIAMATDIVAEFIGSALGFKMLFGISLLQGDLITGLVPFLILMLQNHGEQRLEIVIVAVCYILELMWAHPKSIDIIKGMVLFSFPTFDAVFLAAGIVGATIMPHVIYLHSALTQAN